MFLKHRELIMTIAVSLVSCLLNARMCLCRFVRNFPEDWCKGIVIPIFKKGGATGPINLRPITLISHLAKSFTSIVKSGVRIILA